MCLIRRKVTIYPDPNNKATPSFFVIDLVDSEPVTVLHYPEPDEVVKVDEKLLYVVSTDSKEQNARDNPHWKLHGPAWIL